MDTVQIRQETYCRAVSEYNIKIGDLVEGEKFVGNDLIISPLSKNGIMLGISLGNINKGEYGYILISGKIELYVELMNLLHTIK